MQRTEKIIEINAPVERVFDLFSDFESFPRWMSHIKEVRYTGRRYTRWTAEAPLGTSVEWEAETVAFEPDQRIAWRSVRGDVETEGEVDFQETARGTTLLRVILGYDPPAGRIGALVARLFGTNPEEQLEEDLERFAEVAEARARSRRTPARSRGLVDRERERSRRRPEPSGMDDDAYDARDDRIGEAYYTDGRVMRPEVEREYRPRRSEVRDRDRNYDERGGTRSSRREDRSTHERAGRERFDSELREALRGQRESMQRYDEVRRRDERSRRLREESVREEERLRRRAGRGPADERRLYETRMRERARLDEEDARRRDQYGAGAHTTRHAMTPRERELERRRPARPDFEYRGKAFGRGVDKLLDEQDAPSSRWRRRE